MKREIKFRIWAKDPCSNLSKEEMIYLPKWTVFDGRDLVFRTDLDTFWIDSSANGDAILMEFTGLLDKNGNEIYEGDFCQRVLPNGKLGLIIYVKDIRQVWMTNNVSDDEMIVIGNIYENPELLKTA